MTKTVIATVKAAAGQEEKLASMIRELAQLVRKDKGTVKFDVYRDLNERGAFQFLEVYDDEEAFQGHITAEHVQNFNEALKDIAEGGASKVFFVEPFC
ncbi:MAG: putative quinol monooxygenase [Phormidesmis sp.]